MAFIPAVIGFVVANATAIAATAAVVSAGVGIAEAVGNANQKLPSAPGLPATPQLQTAQQQAQAQTKSLLSAQAAGGGTTDITLGSATINQSNVQTKSLLGS